MATVWILVVFLSVPEPKLVDVVGIEFATELECLRAKETVTSSARFTAYCGPKKTEN